MLKKFAKFCIFLFIFNLLALSFATAPVSAAGATLSLSPSTGTYNVGDTINVSVIVNSGGGEGINASDGTVTFDKTLLSVKKVSKDSSIFTLWTSEPAFSNGDGTFSYSGGLPSGPGKGYKGASGVIMNVSFVALAPGEAKVGFSASQVLANDGMGTNILSSSGSAKFTINEKKVEEKKPETTKPETKPETPKEETPTGLLPPMPKISSASHPDENAWYSNNTVELSWKLLADFSGMSMVLDTSSTTDPGRRSEGIVETKKFEDVPDGVNYFHAKFQNKNGWGQVAHRKVMVDVTPPEEFNITIDNGGDPTNPQPKLVFVTSDKTSGIKGYKFDLDGEVKEMDGATFRRAPYEFPVLKPGNHRIAIMVSDQADNIASATKEFMVDPLKAPVITEMPKLITKGDELAIQGTSFYPNATIKIFITKDDKNVKTVETKTDADGNWTYFQQNDLTKGIYHIWARVIDDRGAESLDSMKKTLEVQSPSIICAYGGWIILILIIIILALSAVILYLSRTYKQQRQRAVRESRELEKRMGEIFTALKEEVNELIEMADKKAGYSDAEKRVKDKINEALDISQEFISKEIKDVEKEIE